MIAKLGLFAPKPRRQLITQAVSKRGLLGAIRGCAWVFAYGRCDRHQLVLQPDFVTWVRERWTRNGHRLMIMVCDDS